MEVNSNDPDYFYKFEHLNMVRSAKGVLEVRLTTNDGPIVFTGKDHHHFVEAFSQIAQDRDNKVIILTGSGDEFFAQIDGPRSLDEKSLRTSGKIAEYPRINSPPYENNVRRAIEESLAGTSRVRSGC